MRMNTYPTRAVGQRSVSRAGGASASLFLPMRSSPVSGRICLRGPHRHCALHGPPAEWQHVRFIRDRGKPFKFKLGAEQVIPGLDKGIPTKHRMPRRDPRPARLRHRGFVANTSELGLVFDLELITFQ